MCDIYLDYHTSGDSESGQPRASRPEAVMCLNRRRLMVKGEMVHARCNRCEQCISDRVRDLTGRCYAEQKYSVGAHCITLTYGKSNFIGGSGDIDGANVLDYTHVMGYLKRVRSAGYPCRYVVCGEYGSRKQRAHWHILLFWQLRVPKVPHHVFDAQGKSRCLDDPWWGHGHTYWDSNVDQSTVRYLCKYLTKSSRDPDAQSLIRRSTVPMLGAVYFDKWAGRHVEQMLPFRERSYTIAGSIDPKTGKPWRYYLSDSALRYCLASYLRQWSEVHGGHPPLSDLLEKYLDSIARPEVKLHRRPFVRRSKPHNDPPVGFVVRFSEPHNIWLAERGLDRLFWSYDGDGLPAWSILITSESEARQRRRERFSADEGGAAAYASASLPSRARAQRKP